MAMTTTDERRREPAAGREAAAPARSEAPTLEWDRSECDGCTFVTSLPAGAAEAQVFAIRVLRGDVEIRRETIALHHPPVFGADPDDVQALNQRIDEIMSELGLRRTPRSIEALERWLRQQEGRS